VKLSQKFYVSDSSIHGKGLFAKIQFKKGSFLGTFKGPEVSSNGSHVLWVQRGKTWTGRRGHNVLRYINHSKRPRAAFDGFELYVVADIRAHDEITIDYGEEF